MIRGAKLHISAASLCHDLLVMPTKSMKPGEEDYAITCAVPVNSPGVQRHQHDLPPQGRRRPPLPGEQPGSHPRRVRGVRRRVRAGRAGVPRRRDVERRGVRPLARAVGAPRRHHGHGAPGRRAGRAWPSSSPRPTASAGVPHIRDKIDEMRSTPRCCGPAWRRRWPTPRPRRRATTTRTSCSPTPPSTRARRSSTAWSATCTTSRAGPCSPRRRSPTSRTPTPAGTWRSTWRPAPT